MQRSKKSHLVKQAISAVLLFGVAFATSGAEQMMRALPAPTAASSAVHSTAVAVPAAMPSEAQSPGSQFKPMPLLAPSVAPMSQLKPTPQEFRGHTANEIVPGQVTTGQKIANPRSANTNIIGVLRAQKQAGDSERTAIMSSPHRAGVGLPTGSTHTLSAPVPPVDPAGAPPGGTPGTTPPTNPGTPIGAPTSLGSKSAAKGVMRLPSTTIIPPTPEQPTRGSAGQGMAYSIACNGPGIRTVNKQANGTIFTPDPQFNKYTIKGCNFGDTPGQAHLFGSFAAGQVAMQIEFWSDEEIDAKVDPQITGELDQDNVTLVVAPAGAAQQKKSGFKFYAMRESTLLARIPQSAVTLAQVTDTGGKPVFIQYASPGVSGSSALVTREALNVFKGGHSDYFDFDKIKLKPGFTTESFQLQTWVLQNTCGDAYQVQGSWEAGWAGDNLIKVSFPMQHCHWPLGINVGIPYIGADRDYSLSRYALSVWVSGPRGVSPQ